MKPDRGWRRNATPNDHTWLPSRLGWTSLRRAWKEAADRPEDGEGEPLRPFRPCPVRDCRRAKPLGDALNFQDSDQGRGGQHRRGRPSFQSVGGISRSEDAVRTFCPALGSPNSGDRRKSSRRSIRRKSRGAACATGGLPRSPPTGDEHPWIERKRKTLSRRCTMSLKRRRWWSWRIIPA